MDGRPLWQPPISKYSALIGKENEKKREVVMKYFDGDQPNTEFMDEETEDEIESMYILCIIDNTDATKEKGTLET